MEKLSAGARAFKISHKSGFVWDMGDLTFLHNSISEFRKLIHPDNFRAICSSLFFPPS